MTEALVFLSLFGLIVSGWVAIVYAQLKDAQHVADLRKHRADTEERNVLQAQSEKRAAETQAAEWKKKAERLAQDMCELERCLKAKIDARDEALAAKNAFIQELKNYICADGEKAKRRKRA